jgi:hypothetical protein
MLTVSCWLVLLLVVLLAWLGWVWLHRPRSPGRSTATDPVQRLRPEGTRPRTPHDCPACRQQALARTPNTYVQPVVRPWSAVKSRRGAPKRIATEGFACPNRSCTYYQITDAQIHALVGDGAHGRCERIQTLRCQACNTTFSSRRDTPLYGLKTASQRVAEVLTALAEELDVAAATRVLGHCHATITTWLTRAGEHSVLLHDRWFRHLYLPHIQLDELRTRLRSRARTPWLWLAVDPRAQLCQASEVAVAHQQSRLSA